MCKREDSKIYELHIWALYQINEKTKRQKYEILLRQIGELEENAFLGWEELFCKSLELIQLLGGIHVVVICHLLKLTEKHSLP